MLAHAAGPAKVATLDRSLWPEKISDAASFDKASRFEILQFASVYLEQDFGTAQAVQAFTGVAEPAMENVLAWQSRLERLLLENFQAASVACKPDHESCGKAADWNELKALVTKWKALQLLSGSIYQRWYGASREFYGTYLYEQARLAALSGRISSEIRLLDEHELDGSAYPDRSFLLTFDDGPATGEKTPELVRYLNFRAVNATFFVLGERLEAELLKRGKDAMIEMYDSQCVASHGYAHKSHAKWEEWKASLEKTAGLIREAGLTDSATMPDFRPPYGQRTAELSAFVAASGANVVLWNIDSQDWNARLSAPQIRDRMMTLMLLWRRGILLFHDVHPKAMALMPDLLDFMEASNLTIAACN